MGLHAMQSRGRTGEELCGRLATLHPEVGLESVSQWGCQSGRKAECEAGESETGTHKDKQICI